MHRLKVLKERYTFLEVLDRAVDPRLAGVHDDKHAFRAYAQAVGRLTEISVGLQKICKRYADFDLTVPEVAALGTEAAALPRTETRQLMVARLSDAKTALAAALDVSQFGRATWPDDESCRFTFFEPVWERGILRNKVRRIAHQHDLVDARERKLPVQDIVIPKRGREIIALIPAPLQRYTRVITGLEVRKEEREASNREEATWLAQALKSGARQLGRAKTAAAMGLAAAGGALVAGTTGLSRISKALAVADPAIVIGEVCLFGWED
jgi:hypothetical protein